MGGRAFIFFFASVDVRVRRCTQRYVVEVLGFPSSLSERHLRFPSTLWLLHDGDARAAVDSHARLALAAHGPRQCGRLRSRSRWRHIACLWV